MECKQIQTCQYFLERKGRFCRFQVVTGERFCGYHLHEVTGHGKKRIPCPVDPRHSVVEEDLEKHLYKCAALKRKAAIEQEATYFEDINRDSTVCLNLPEGETRSKQRSAFAESIGPGVLINLIQRVEKQVETFSKLEKNFELPEISNSFLQPDGKRPFSVKHAKQQASILGSMMQADVFEGDPPTVVEFGAGKAYLSSMIADCTTCQSFVVLDYQAFKFKAERSMKGQEDLTIRRLRIDLKDFEVSKLPELESGKFAGWIACGKHLCGASTDYALQSCTRAFSQQTSMTNTKLKGIFLTTCCHHRCDWESYVGKEIFLSFGFTPEEFELISWMTGWALCEQHQRVMKVERPGVELQEKDILQDGCYWRRFSKEFKMEIGMKCKRLIDEGRRLWLINNRFESKLTLYVPDDVSPENKLISSIPCL